MIATGTDARGAGYPPLAVNCAASVGRRASLPLGGHDASRLPAGPSREKTAVSKSVTQCEILLPGLTILNLDTPCAWALFASQRVPHRLCVTIHLLVVKPTFPGCSKLRWSRPIPLWSEERRVTALCLR